jgi:hypothetical protein
MTAAGTGSKLLERGNGPGRSIHHFDLNPFFVLGATTHDDRRKLVVLAETRGLQLESGVCDQARADLSNPRSRLSAEIDWFPGVSPGQVAVLLERLRTDPQSIRREPGLPALARANLLAAVWRGYRAEAATSGVAEFIIETGAIVDEISAAAVMRDINADRTISGFPPVQSEEQVQAELAGRMRRIHSLIRDALNPLPCESIVELMRMMTSTATDTGRRHASPLIDELVDGYEMDARAVLEQDAALANRLIASARERMTSGSGAIEPFLRCLEQVVRNWDRIAQPIQLSYQARGLNHKPSLELGYAVRNLAIELWNQQRMLQVSTKFTLLAGKLFAEIPQLAERLKDDQAFFATMTESITYRVEVGRFFKNTLSISPEGIRWKHKHYTLDSLSRIRWGALTRTVNGIPKWTTYTIGFGDARSETCIETRNQEMYSNFTGKLWYAGGVRLLAEFLEILKAGGAVRFGNAYFRDDGVELMHRKPFGRKQVVRCSWDQVVVGDLNGSLSVSAKQTPSAWVVLSYRDLANVHVLAKALALVLEPPLKQKMSALLQS